MRARLRHLGRGVILSVALLFAFLLARVATNRWTEHRVPQLDVPGSADLGFAVFAAPRPAPATRFTDGGGRGRSLGDFRGRVVLLDIWATWCAPCAREMPSLDRLEGNLGGAQFIVLPVSIDRDGGAAVAAFYRRLGIKRLGVWLDPLGDGTSVLGLPGLPTSFLIDREGRIVVRAVGDAEWDGPEMIARIRRYLPPDAVAAPGR
jgi:thiol-disulfide isomerase/thioredoxin